MIPNWRVNVKMSAYVLFNFFHFFSANLLEKFVIKFQPNLLLVSNICFGSEVFQTAIPLKWGREWNGSFELEGFQDYFNQEDGSSTSENQVSHAEGISVRLWLGVNAFAHIFWWWVVPASPPNPVSQVRRLWSCLQCNYQEWWGAITAIYKTRKLLDENASSASFKTYFGMLGRKHGTIRILRSEYKSPHMCPDAFRASWRVRASEGSRNWERERESDLLELATFPQFSAQRPIQRWMHWWCLSLDPCDLSDADAPSLRFLQFSLRGGRQQTEGSSPPRKTDNAWFEIILWMQNIQK